MKDVFLYLMVIAGLTTFLSLPVAYSDISSNTKYLIQSSGYLTGTQNIFDSTIALQVTTGGQNGSNNLATLDNGLVTIDDNHYLNSGPWQISIVRDSKFMIILGDAQDQNGNIIHLNLFGRIIDSNQDGSLYYFTGKITGAETMKVVYSAKVTPVTTIISKPGTTPTTTPQPQTNTVNISIIPGAHNVDNQQYFSTSSVNVALGTTIIWTNNDSVPHRIQSGVASAIVRDQSAPAFTADGKIDSGVILPGQSFQYTITSFDTTAFLNPAVANYLGLSQAYTAGDITFFDPNYGWMVGVIGPITQPTAEVKTTQISIVQGASNSNNIRFLSPSSLQITPGTIVVWVNTDSVPHRIQSGHVQTITQGSAGSTVVNAPNFLSDGRFDTGILAPGQRYQMIISGSNTYQFFDPSFTWINGVVVSASPSAQAVPIQISILPGSSIPQGSATQQQFNQYNNYYAPSDIQIVPGTTIIWANNDSIAHTIFSGVSTQRVGTGNYFTPDGRITSGKIAPGQTFQVVINDTGIIRFYDPQYMWMNGVIVSLPPTASRTIAAPSHNPYLH